MCSQKARRVQILGGGISCRQSTDVVNLLQVQCVHCPQLRAGQCRLKGSARAKWLLCFWHALSCVLFLSATTFEEVTKLVQHRSCTHFVSSVQKKSLNWRWMNMHRKRAMRVITEFVSIFTVAERALSFFWRTSSGPQQVPRSTLFQTDQPHFCGALSSFFFSGRSSAASTSSPPPAFSSLARPLVLIRTCTGLPAWRMDAAILHRSIVRVHVVSHRSDPNAKILRHRRLEQILRSESERLVIVFSSLHGPSQAQCALHHAVLDRSIEEVRSAEDSSVVDSEEGFPCRSTRFFPKRIGRRRCGTSLPHFF